MTDRELLEKAAKAAGIEIKRVHHGLHQWVDLPVGEVGGGWWELWDPLVNGGDALRLAVKLKIDSLCDGKLDDGSPCMSAVFPVRGDYEAISEPVRGGDEYEAICRAIVRAAAEIYNKKEPK